MSFPVLAPRHRARELKIPLRSAGNSAGKGKPRGGAPSSLFAPPCFAVICRVALAAKPRNPRFAAWWVSLRSTHPTNQKKKGSGTPTDVHSNLRTCGCGALLREGSPIGVPPRFSPQRVSHPHGSVSGQASWVRLENIIHRVLAPAQFNLTIPDRFGNPVRPREWFLVPLSVIDEAVERIKDNSITQFEYDPQTASLKKIDAAA
ncbi:MAG: GIY-YIG nuclease family protein [Xanthobacteraceae bacterium]